MARLKDWRGAGKTLSLKRSLMIYANRGALVASWWPKKRGKPKSPVTTEQNEWFRQANLLAKYATGEDQWMAIEITKGSPWYPRDILISAMRGRLFETLNIDDQEYRAVAVREDVSSDLDFLAGDEPGTIIVRGQDLWEHLLPGTNGNLLTSNGPGNLPTYNTPGGSNALTLATAIPRTAFSAFGAATKGNVFKVQSSFQVHELGTRIDVILNEVYRGSVFHLDTSYKILEIMGETANIVPSATAVRNFGIPLITPADLTFNEIYALCWTRRDGADDFGMKINLAVADLPMIGLPVIYFNPLNDMLPHVTLAKAAPAVNDVMTANAATGYFINATVTI